MLTSYKDHHFIDLTWNYWQRYSGNILDCGQACEYQDIPRDNQKLVVKCCIHI